VIAHSRPTIESDDIGAADRVLASGYLAQGREVRAFEEDMAALLHMRGGVATNSGTAALHLALLTLGVGPGAEVLIPSYACAALLHAVHLAGARARLVDSEIDGVNMSADDAARRVSPATRAIIVPHLFGTMAEVWAFRRFGIPIIENCAQALGATFQGWPAGETGDITVLSFYATKLITTGEGGMLLSRSSGMLDEARDLRDYDKRASYRLRFNYKLTDLQAAIGRTQLRKLPRFLERRREIARSYQDLLGGLATVYAPIRDSDACYRYVLAVSDPERFIQDMAAGGVECARPVHRPLHELVKSDACPSAARAYRHAVSLPIYPSLTDTETRMVGALAAQALSTRTRSMVAGDQAAQFRSV
jgi:dTDP-4-amino-4,6-dideoxygalactose transaminase